MPAHGAAHEKIFEAPFFLSATFLPASIFEDIYGAFEKHLDETLGIITFVAPWQYEWTRRGCRL